jgi:hypothetical protein
MTELPEHITIFPLRVEGQYLGMIIAYGPAKLKDREILVWVEKLLKEVSESLSRVASVA